MNASFDYLDPKTHKQVFEEEILPDRILGKASHERPAAIILGGQPGAGKGGLARKAEAELKDDAVNIDPDALRDYHPRINELRSQHPYTWSGYTHADAGQWADELRDAAVAGRKNFIFDTTLSNGPWSAELIKDLQAKGYEVEVRVIASPKLESELGVDQRFSDKLDAEGYGRYVPKEVRDPVYDKLPASLDTIHAETHVPIRIFNREGRELYDSRTDARSPGQVLIEAREARLRDPAIMRDLKRGWHAQQQWHEDLPEAITRNAKVAPDIAQRLLTERSGVRVVEGVPPYVEQADGLVHADYVTRVHPDVVKGVGALGAAAFAYDATTTARQASALLNQGNRTGAASEIEHFGSRNLGMLGGAALGAEAFGAAGIESGPLDFVVAGVGGIVGAVAGDKLADAYDNHKIYHQTDPQGIAWRYDPTQPQAGWTRTVTDAFVERGMSLTHVETAPPALAGRLTFQASNTAVELALAHTARPRDPYTQPDGPHDMPGHAQAPWTRDAQTGQWSRRVTDAVLEHGLRSAHVETAAPARAAELDAAAQRTLRENLTNSTRGIAERYQAVYAERHWQPYGPVPPAVTHALATPANTLEASDGNTYTRGKDGAWTTPGRLWGRNPAEGNVRNELEATERLRTAGAATMAHPASPAADKVAARVPHAPAVVAPAEPPARTLPAIPEHLRDFRHPGHPMHASYATMLRHVHALEDRGRMPHGEHSEHAAATLLDRHSADRLGWVKSLEMHGQGRDMAMHLVTGEHGGGERVTRVGVADVVARPVERTSGDWSLRALPHLYQTQAREPESPTHGRHTQDPSDRRHPDHPRHTDFVALRERIGAAYALYGVERSDGQLDRATAAVMLDVQKQRPTAGVPDQVQLLPDPHTGRIGPGSGVATHDTPSPWFGTATQAAAMQQPAEAAFRQLDQLQAAQSQQHAMQAQRQAQQAQGMGR